MAAVGRQVFMLSLVNYICITYASQTRSISSFEALNIPYQVSIRNTSGHHLCGGAIIGKKHILTAAHCIIDTNRLPYPDVREVVLGTSDRFNWTADNVFQIVKKTIPVDFSRDSFLQNDIAVLEVDKDIKFTPYQQPVKLPRKDAKPRATAVSSGWGATQWSKKHEQPDAYPRYLHFFHQKIISEQKCRMMLPGVSISSNHLCAWAGGRRASCDGDNGGPLVIGEYIVGINSWNKKCDSFYPDVYTRVYNYVNWIKDAITD